MVFGSIEHGQLPNQMREEDTFILWKGARCPDHIDLWTCEISTQPMSRESLRREEEAGSVFRLPL